MHRKSYQLALATLVASFVFATPAAFGFSSGVTTNTFPNPMACNACHSGGLDPTVTLTGPTSVAPSSVNEYTLTVFELGSQTHAGLNVEAPDGVLAVGGSASAQTQAAPNISSGLDEITHVGAKAAAGGFTEFSFLWTAPASFSSVTLTGWGNAVDSSGSQLGDRAASATLEVFNSSPPGAGCPSTVDGGCATPFEKGLLLVKEDGAKSKLVAKLLKGPALDQADFGNPLSGGGTIYDLCLYDGVGSLVHADDAYQVDRAGDMCDGKDCWKAVGKDPPDGKGFKFKEKAGNSNGITKMLFKGGDPGKSKILVKGKGANLPTGITAVLASAGAATIQVRADDGECASVTVFDIKKNDPNFFKAK